MPRSISECDTRHTISYHVVVSSIPTQLRPESQRCLILCAHRHHHLPSARLSAESATYWEALRTCVDAKPHSTLESASRLQRTNDTSTTTSGEMAPAAGVIDSHKSRCHRDRYGRSSALVLISLLLGADWIGSARSLSHLHADKLTQLGT